MDLLALYYAHPFWWWVALAAIFLAVEVATGTSYLLWPSAAAGVVALLVLLVRPPAGTDLAVFALLTIVATLVARRYIRRPGDGPDINDPHHRLAGRQGTAVDAFVRGEGRVFVDGKEWAAETRADVLLAKGDRVEVARVLDGGRLRVEPI